MVFATHYLQEAADFADRIVLMRSGRKIVDGPADEITRNGERTITCVWDGPGTPQEVADELGLPDAVGHQNGRVRFTVPDTDALALSLLTSGRAHDLTIAAASLDDVFLDLTSDDSTDSPAPRTGSRRTREGSRS